MDLRRSDPGPRPGINRTPPNRASSRPRFFISTPSRGLPELCHLLLDLAAQLGLGRKLERLGPDPSSFLLPILLGQQEAMVQADLLLEVGREIRRGGPDLLPQP